MKHFEMEPARAFEILNAAHNMLMVTEWSPWVHYGSITIRCKHSGGINPRDHWSISPVKTMGTH